LEDRLIHYAVRVVSDERLAITDTSVRQASIQRKRPEAVNSPQKSTIVNHQSSINNQQSSIIPFRYVSRRFGAPSCSPLANRMVWNNDGLVPMGTRLATKSLAKKGSELGRGGRPSSRRVRARSVGLRGELVERSWPTKTGWWQGKM
jgi:hypothetical protein